MKIQTKYLLFFGECYFLGCSSGYTMGVTSPYPYSTFLIRNANSLMAGFEPGSLWVYCSRCLLGMWVKFHWVAWVENIAQQYCLQGRNKHDTSCKLYTMTWYFGWCSGKHSFVVLKLLSVISSSMKLDTDRKLFCHCTDKPLKSGYWPYRGTSAWCCIRAYSSWNDGDRTHFTALTDIPRIIEH